ncbi:restriction endonuclease subunit R [Cyanobacteria bacterium FACHB-63]|nr:restriction endonuclease subunit R [Cyanobacteria bacterium FACHB-63]
MAFTLQAKNVTLRDLIDRFELQLIRDEQFFREWQDDLPTLTEIEQQFLDRVIDGFLNLLDYPPVLEGVVRMAVLDPLLFLGGFYLPPFHICSEPSVEIAAEDEGVIITGNLDALVLNDQLWVLVVESKRASFSVEEGLPQILSYMLANPNPERPCFGLITTGGSFMFVKLIQESQPRYATSKLFGIRNSGDLAIVFSILKRLGQLSRESLNRS